MISFDPPSRNPHAPWFELLQALLHALPGWEGWQNADVRPLGGGLSGAEVAVVFGIGPRQPLPIVAKIGLAGAIANERKLYNAHVAARLPPEHAAATEWTRLHARAARLLTPVEIKKKGRDRQWYSIVAYDYAGELSEQPIVSLDRFILRAPASAAVEVINRLLALLESCFFGPAVPTRPEENQRPFSLSAIPWKEFGPVIATAASWEPAWRSLAGCLRTKWHEQQAKQDSSVHYNPVVCHGDLRCANILVTERTTDPHPFLIDYGSVQFGNPLFDLARLEADLLRRVALRQPDGIRILAEVLAADALAPANWGDTTESLLGVIARLRQTAHAFASQPRFFPRGLRDPHRVFRLYLLGHSARFARLDDPDLAAEPLQADFLWFVLSLAGRLLGDKENLPLAGNARDACVRPSSAADTPLEQDLTPSQPDFRGGSSFRYLDRPASTDPATPNEKTSLSRQVDQESVWRSVQMPGGGAPFLKTVGTNEASTLPIRSTSNCRASASSSHQEPSQDAQVAAIELEQIRETVLLRFYSGSPANLFPYGFTLGSKTRRTSHVTSRAMIGLSMPLENVTYQVCSLPRQDAHRADICAEAAREAARQGVLRRDVWDDPIYRLCGLRVDRSAQTMWLALAPMGFLAARHGAEGILHDELVTSYLESKHEPTPSDGIAASVASRLPYRRLLLPDLNSFNDLERRVCIGGINALFVLPEDGAFRFLYSRRSRTDVLDNFGLLQTLPRGFHGPMSLDRAAVDLSLRRTLAREVWEEIAGGEDLVQRALRDSRAHDIVRALEMALRDAAIVRVTALSYSLDSGSYVVHMLVVLKEGFRKYVGTLTGPFRPKTGLSWLWEGNFESIGRQVQELTLSPEVTEEVLLERPWCAQPRWADGCVMTIVEGIRELHRLTGYPCMPTGLKVLDGW